MPDDEKMIKLKELTDNLIKELLIEDKNCDIDVVTKVAVLNVMEGFSNLLAAKIDKLKEGKND